MRDVTASMPDHDERPSDQPIVGSVESAEIDQQPLAHAPDYPEPMTDAMLNTDAPEIVLRKKVLENEGGKFESAYVVQETEMSRAEFTESITTASYTSVPRPESPGEMTWRNEGGFDNSDQEEAFIIVDTTQTNEAAELIQADEPTEPLEISDKPLSVNERRLEELTRYVERYPNTPTNYVLRGEVYLALKQDALAGADFNRALEMAGARLDELSWGYANAAFIDRAQNGLRRIRS